MQNHPALTLAEAIYSAVDRDDFSSMPDDEIDRAIFDLHRFDQLNLASRAEISAAVNYLRKMKRPRADRQNLGQSVKDIAVGLKIMALHS